MRDEDFFLRRYSTGETPMLHLAFFDTSVEALAEALYQRQYEIRRLLNVPEDGIEKQKVQGSLADKLDLLLPLSYFGRKELVVGTQSGWTAYFMDRYGVGGGITGRQSICAKNGFTAVC